MAKSAVVQIKGMSSVKNRKRVTAECSSGSNSKRRRQTEPDPEASTTDVPEVPIDFLQKSCDAMQKACLTEYEEKSGRQLDRRSMAQPFKLANYQKRLWVDRYLAARRRNQDVDYAVLATKTQFKAFKGNPQELQAHHKSLLKELYAGYQEVLKKEKVKEELTNATLEKLLESIQKMLSDTKEELKRELQENKTLLVLVDAAEEEKQKMKKEFEFIYTRISASFEEEVKGLKARLEEEGSRVQELQGELTEEKSRSSALREELEYSQKVESDTQSSNFVVKDLVGELKKLAQELAHEKAVSNGYKAKVTQFEKEVGKLKKEIDTGTAREQASDPEEALVKREKRATERK